MTDETVAPSIHVAAPGQLYDQPTAAPTAKVQAALATAVVVAPPVAIAWDLLIAWLWSMLAPASWGLLPDYVIAAAAALAGGLTAAAAAWLKRERAPK